MLFYERDGALIAKRAAETLRVEAWGSDSLRVRATMLPEIQDTCWALT